MSRPDEDYSALVFRWRATDGPWWRLGFWIVLSSCMLGIWLLLFEVVYPVASRRPRTEQHIMLLDPSLPKARQLAAAAADRSFLLMSSNATAAPRLADLRPVFTPGFKDFQLQVKDLPETGAPASFLPRLFAPERPLLPPVASVPEPVQPAPAAKPFRLVAVPHDGLENRTLVHPMGEVSAGSAAVGYANLRMRIAVAPDGHLLSQLPLSGDSGSLLDDRPDAAGLALQDLEAALGAIRFAPVQGPPVQWGIIAFEWKELPP